MKWETIYKVKSEKSKVKIEDLLDILLENRGIKTERDKEWFLNPTHPTGFSLQDVGLSRKAVQKAVHRIENAIRAKEKIVVYGDYDADGICATAILWETLDGLGADALPYIPDRFDEGYGLNANSVSVLKEKVPGLKLIITVDNGIVAFDGVESANKLGVEVIISDHHEAGKKLPSAYSIIHTTQTSGAGVSWFLAKELNRRIKSNTHIRRLELVAIGVVADQLPLLGINRALVKFGLEELNKTQRLGLKKLLMVSGLIGKRIDTYEVGFAIAPRINASGRLANGIDALRLLCTRNRERAEKLAILMNDLNRERQEVVDSAVRLMERNLKIEEGEVVVLSSAEYHEGVIGLIAGKIVEKSGLPAIVLSERGEIAKASARSISGFNIVEAIRAQGELILEGGGHAMAAGFTINVSDIAAFTRKINKYAKAFLTPELSSKKIKVDVELPFSLINERVYNVLKALEPYGIGNPAPVFVTEGVEVVDQMIVGGRHLKMVLEKDGKRLDAIYFNFADTVKDAKIDICYRLSKNEWNGRTKIELILKDIHGEKVS